MADILEAFSAVGMLGYVVIAWLLPIPIVAMVANVVWRVCRPRDSRAVRFRGAILIGISGLVLLTIALPDGWPWTAFPALQLDDTEWAPMYSGVAFARVQQGASEEQVVAAVGDPLARYPNVQDVRRETWCWTRSPHSSHYRVRCIEFADHRVVEKRSEYWVD